MKKCDFLRRGVTLDT